jgi:hypothetical protein
MEKLCLFFELPSTVTIDVLPGEEDVLRRRPNEIACSDPCYCEERHTTWYRSRYFYCFVEGAVLECKLLHRSEQKSAKVFF